MVITSFYLLNIFPRMRTLSSSNSQHPTANNQTCSLRCALYIISQQSTPITQAKHVPSDAHFTSLPNNQHPTPKPNMFPQMRTLSSSPNNHHPTPKPNMFPQMRTLSSSPNNHHPTPKPKHVPSDAHFIIITQQSTTITHQS